MAFPLIGVGLPTFEPNAEPESILAVASAADRLGFHSVSTTDRILLPAGPDWSNDFGLPEHASFDLIELLTWVAAHTERVRLMPAVVITPFQSPVILARRLATLDRLSGGRLDVGVGQGWLPEEFAAVGVPLPERTARFEEHLAVMRACWGPDPVSADGRFYPVPAAKIGPKPEGGTLPVLIGAVAPKAVARAARLGDGFVLGFRDWDSTLDQIKIYRDSGGTGRIVLRAGPMLADAQHRERPTTFTRLSVVEDLRRAADLGIAEVQWDLNVIGMPAAAQVESLEWLADMVELS